MSGDEGRREIPDVSSLRDAIDLPAAERVAHEAFARAKEAARARGARPGQVPRRPLAPELSGARKGGRDPQLLGDALGTLLRQRGWVEEVKVGGVIGRWREVVGDEIADHCTPLTFEEGVLVIQADSTAWATQLTLLTPQILGRLTQDLGEGVVTSVAVDGPAGRSFRRGPRTVRGRGPRDTYG